MDRASSRIERLRRTLKADPVVDAFLVTSETNVGYLTGFTGDSSVLVLTPRRTVLVSDGRYTTQIEAECPHVEAHIRPLGQTLFAAVAEVIAKLGCRTAAFEANSLTVAQFEELRDQAESVAFRGVANRVEALRAIKDRDEVARIRQAIDAAERAFRMLESGLHPDETEKAVADALEGYLRRCGATCASFPSIVATGERAALPHARPTATRRLDQADFTLVDWGATVGGYRSDLTRVLVTGKVTPKFEKVYRTVLAAQEAGIAAIRPGARACDVDAAARVVITQAGFGRYFDHGLGHGLGLDIHEAPRLRKDSDLPLRAGMVVTVEPGVYLPGWGGIRIEDDVLVTPEGCEVLTHLPKSLADVRAASR